MQATRIIKDRPMARRHGRGPLQALGCFLEATTVIGCPVVIKVASAHRTRRTDRGLLTCTFSGKGLARTTDHRFLTPPDQGP